MTARKTLGLASVVIALLLAFLAWSFFKPPEEASGPIEAEPVALEQPAETDAQEPSADAEESTDAYGATDSDAPAGDEAADAPAGDESAETGADEGGESGAVEPEGAEAAAGTGEAGAAAGPTIYEIQPGVSVARFEINEVLRGAPTHVVGQTDQVAGQIALDPADPAAVEVGEILINVRTLGTDSEFRNRAIKNRILLTDQHEFVRFTTTSVEGLPASLTVGEPAAVQVTGDLTIVGTTLPVTFEGSVTLRADGALEGSGATTIRYADFGLTIPASRSVDAVEDSLILGLDFVAKPQS